MSPPPGAAGAFSFSGFSAITASVVRNSAAMEAAFCRAERVRTLPAGQGLNAATGEYVDMFKAGIIDPAKVTRSALQNAASIAGLFLTTEAVIAEKPEKEKAPAAPGGGDMDF